MIVTIIIIIMLFYCASIVYIISAKTLTTSHHRKHHHHHDHHHYDTSLQVFFIQVHSPPADNTKKIHSNFTFLRVSNTVLQNSYVISANILSED